MRTYHCTRCLGNAQRSKVTRLPPLHALGKCSLLRDTSSHSGCCHASTALSLSRGRSHSFLYSMAVLTASRRASHLLSSAPRDPTTVESLTFGPQPALRVKPHLKPRNRDLSSYKRSILRLLVSWRSGHHASAYSQLRGASERTTLTPCTLLRIDYDICLVLARTYFTRMDASARQCCHNYIVCGVWSMQVPLGIGICGNPRRPVADAATMG